MQQTIKFPKTGENLLEKKETHKREEEKRDEGIKLEMDS